LAEIRLYKNKTIEKSGSIQEEITISKFPYWVNEVYGLGYWLKDYGFYPKGLPIFSYMDHGMTLFDKIPLHEIYNDASIIFKFSPRLTTLYRQCSKKPAYNVLNPTIHYRVSRKIEKLSIAKGSLFFVAHTTPDIDDLTEWSNFIESFNNIPAEFHPIDVCLHPTDIKKGLGAVFEKAGFNVVFAGDAHSKEFVENFYTLLRKYKYSLSNLLGSYVFYSVEMGIPFSLYGEEPKYYNKGDSNIEMGRYDSYKSQPTYQRAKSLFGGFHTSIDKEQEYFVNQELGKFTSISRLKTCYLLYRTYLRACFLNPSNIRYLKNIITDFFKKIWKTN
jgi:hypothetical protein